MKNRSILFAAVCVVFLGMCGLFLTRYPLIQPVGSFTGASIVFVLDPGHGGEDGGAVSVSGASESGINLAVAQKMDLILGLYGKKAVLLRETDRSLHTEGAVTLREKKVSDLKNRVRMVNAQPGAVLLSVHQNSYPGQQYWGLQTFYAHTEHSQQLAECMQKAIQSQLQIENRRQSKPIPDNVYLMNHVECPAVLVECGFLTNPEEEARLRNETYQCKLAAVLTAAAMNWASLFQI